MTEVKNKSITIKSHKVSWLIPTFEEVTVEKLVGGFFASAHPE